MFPPAPTLLREAQTDLQLGPYAIRKGEWLAVSAFAMHRDPKHWKVRPPLPLVGSSTPRPVCATRLCLSKKRARAGVHSHMRAFRNTCLSAHTITQTNARAQTRNTHARTRTDAQHTWVHARTYFYTKPLTHVPTCTCGSSEGPTCTCRSTHVHVHLRHVRSTHVHLRQLRR